MKFPFKVLNWNFVAMTTALLRRFRKRRPPDTNPVQGQFRQLKREDGSEQTMRHQSCFHLLPVRDVQWSLNPWISTRILSAVEDLYKTLLIWFQHRPRYLLLLYWAPIYFSYFSTWWILSLLTKLGQEQTVTELLLPCHFPFQIGAGSEDKDGECDRRGKIMGRSFDLVIHPSREGARSLLLREEGLLW